MGENIYRIFDVVWKLSLVGGYCVLLVLLARLLLKKAPKWCSYLLWGIVFVRLCCPVLPQTGISLIPERLLAVGTETMYGQSADGYGNNGVLPDVDPNGQSTWQQAGNLHAGTAGNMPGAVGLANENRNVANAIDNESDANAFGTDGADGSQAAGNAADGGYLADNRDNADGGFANHRSRKQKQWCSHGGIGYRYKRHNYRKHTVSPGRFPCPCNRMAARNGRIYGVSCVFLFAYA